MISREATRLDREQSVPRVRAVRAEQARAAALLTCRIELARAAAGYGAAARWTNEYRRSGARCRQQIIRGEREAT